MDSTQNNLSLALQDLAAAIVQTTRLIMIRRGILQNSDIVSSVEVIPNNSSLELWCNSYIENIEKGRKKYTNKIPIADILYFLKKRSISPKRSRSLNELAVAVQEAIWKNGIKPKTGLINDIVESNTELIINSLVQYFDLTVIDNQLQVVFN